MFRLTLQTIRARKARFVLTAIAVILGVAFMAGTLVLTDTINKAYDGIAGTTFASTDVVVQSPRTVDAGEGAHRAGNDPRVGPRRRPAAPTVSSPPTASSTAPPASSDATASSSTTAWSRPRRSAWPGRRPTTLNPLHLVAGHAPAADDEVVIDRASARDGDFAPGDTVRVRHRRRVRRSTPSPASRPTGPTTTPVARESWRSRRRPRRTVLGEPGRVDSVRAVGAAGVTQAELAARVRDARCATAPPTSR